MSHARVDGLESGGQPRTAVGDDEQQFVSLQAAAVQIVEQRFPVGLALAMGA